ncbi:hypothetical protein BGZ46_003520, partial [Entomortierella lignicola]
TISVVALTAKGFVRSVGTTSFTGAFTLDNGSRRDFTGQFDEPVGQFVSMNAQPKYTDLGQLTGQHFYSGIIRTKGISFKITNGPVITAHIDQSITPSPVYGQ